jgi:hypothetical protein
MYVSNLTAHCKIYSGENTDIWNAYIPSSCSAVFYVATVTIWAYHK